MLRLIKNAIVFKAALPAAEHMTTHLAELPHGPLTEAQLCRTSFVPNSTTNELVTPFEGGYSFCLRMDEKILPTSIVRARAAERFAEAEAKMTRRLKKVERDAIREQVFLELAKVALIKTTVVTAFYHHAEQLLVVATPSKRLAQVLIALVIKVVGSVKTETIRISDIKHGLTTRLGNHLEGAVDNPPFGDFELGEFCELKKGSEKVSYQISDLSTASSGLSDAIGDGFEVDRIQLTYKDVTFKLTADFHFKSVTFATELEHDEAEACDPAFIWRHEASVQLLQFAAVVTTVCDLLGYQPPANEA
ncbi:MAG: recombination-associated protein RdgC [Armatimonadia bacterium]